MEEYLWVSFKDNNLIKEEIMADQVNNTQDQGKTAKTNTDQAVRQGGNNTDNQQPGNAQNIPKQGQQGSQPKNTGNQNFSTDKNSQQ